MAKACSWPTKSKSTPECSPSASSVDDTPLPSPLGTCVEAQLPPPLLACGTPTYNWVEKMVVALASVRRTADGGIETASYLQAMALVPEVYESILAMPAVTHFMRKDLNGHIANVRGAMASVPAGRGETLQGIVRHALDTTDRAELAKRTSSMVGGVLWLNRATAFIAAILRGLADGRPSREAARAAYDAELRMYHSRITSAFVSRALALCPERGKILERLRLPSEAAGREALAALLGRLEPLTVEILAFLDAMDANFPNRVG